MAGFGDLLGTFLQSNLAQSGQTRMGNALQDLQASLGQPAGGEGGGVLGGVLEMARGGLSQASQNPLQAGGLGAVLGSVLGGGGDSVKGALAGGALAMLAGVALKALGGAGEQSSPVDQTFAGRVPGVEGAQTQPGLEPQALPLGLEQPQTAADQEALETKARLIVKGMINIAKSDGQVSLDEIQRIVGRAEAAGMGTEDQAWLMAELRAPLSLDAFVAEIPDREVAAEIYAASLLAVEVDTQEERHYLREFAEKTGLHPVVVQHIHQSFGVAL